MELNLTPTQHRFLKELAGTTGPVLLKNLKKTTPSDRELLVREGLIEAGRQKRSMTLTLTEKGRTWIATHPEQTKPSGFPSPRQRLFLLRLAFKHPGDSSGGTARLLGPAERAAIMKEKWIEERRQKRSIQFELTDAGWQWVEEHLGDPISGGLAEEAVGGVLGFVRTYLTANGLRLADLIRVKRASVPPAADGQPGQPAPAKQYGNLNAAIRAACLRLGGPDRHRIRLAALRRELDGWPREAVDQALLGLSLAEDLVLVRMDNPQEMNQEDRGAVFKTPSGEERHLLYWTRS